MRLKNLWNNKKLFLKIKRLPPELREDAKNLLMPVSHTAPNRNVLSKCKSAESLGRTKNVAAIPFLEHVIKRQYYWKIRRYSISALRKIGHEKGTPALIHTIKNDQDNDVREEAINALETILHEKSIPVLDYVLKKDNNTIIKCLAAETIAKIGHENGVPALIHAFGNDEDQAVRNKASIMLKKIAVKLPPTHSVNKAIALVNPTTHPNAFLKLYEYIKQTKGRKPADHYHTYANQLKAREPDLKQSQVVA